MAMRIGDRSSRCAVSFAILLQLVALAAAQPAATPPPEDAGGCNGIQLNYTLDGRDRIRPFVPAADSQPYSFRATATVLNSGTRPLRSWALLLTFAHGEVLVGVDGAVLTSGGDLPYNTTAGDGGNATSLSGFPQTDLETPIATAGDVSRIQATVKLVGTLFAGPAPYVPLPSALSLADPAYACAPPTNASTSMSTCCVPLVTVGNGSDDQLDAAAARRSRSFLPRGTGDLVISYDVLQSSRDNVYLAQVTLENNAPLARLDGWRLSWEWQRHEFINSMRGAYPLEVDTASCLYGPQARHYQDFDFSNTLTCDPRPVVLDLPPSRIDDANMGRVEHCCRNGTILPKGMDVAQSKSAFRMEVYKMPPDLNRTELYPPANFRIAGSLPQNPDYTCAQPVPVSPAEFPDPSGLASTTLAVASWQVVCNITTTTSSGNRSSESSKPPTCCVSFSAFINESVVPCNTCACGCPRTASSTCSTTAPPMLLPPYALLMPFERRAKEALTWAHDHRLGAAPNPMPCADFCGVSINWHVAADFTGGWSARMTLFNWDDAVDMPDWFAAVVMDPKAYPGFEQAYSFNATPVGNDTIFLKGREGFNFLLRETNVSGVDYPVPGKLQSVLSFTKKMSPDNIDVLAGDGFPSKVFFNGDECAMPLRIPSHAGVINRAGAIPIIMLLCLLLLLL